MKKIFTTTLAIAAITLAAEAAVPAPKLVLPLGKVVESSYNAAEVVWGYERLVDNAGDDPIRGTITFPDGSKKTINAILTDVNGTEGEFPDPEAQGKPTSNNALLFRNFLPLDWETMTYEEPAGVYTLSIPAGVVKVAGEPNPACTLSWTVIGFTELSYMPRATVLEPQSQFVNSLSIIEAEFGGEEMAFAEGQESVNLNVEIDGVKANVTATASVKHIPVGDGGVPSTDPDASGTTEELCVLYIDLSDFLTPADGTLVDIFLPEGLLVNDKGDVNRDQTFSFSLYNYSYDYVVTPEDGSNVPENELDLGIQISWPDGIMFMPAAPGQIIARCGETDTVLTAIESEDDATLTIPLGTNGPNGFQPLPEGAYEIIVPDSYRMILVSANAITGDVYELIPDIILNYTIGDVEPEPGPGPVEPDPDDPDDPDDTGVESIDADGSAVYYNIHGMKVVNPGKGIYIVNGKKVVVK